MILDYLKRCVLTAAVLVYPSIAAAQSSAPIIWIAADYAGEFNQRAMLAVTARVAGRACRLQLDTGVNDAVLLSNAPASGDNSVLRPVEFLGISMVVPTSAEVAERLHECQQGEMVGTLGNAFFESGSLTLDLKASVLIYTPGSTLAGDVRAQPMFYARWMPHGGHPLVELRRAGGALEGYVLLDTGSAASAFTATSRAQWDAVTGSAPLAVTTAVQEFAIPSWGRTLKCFATRSAAPMTVGRWPMGTPLVTYCPDLDFIPPLKLEGLVGLRGFTEAAITIDYVSGRWLVVPSLDQR